MRPSRRVERKALIVVASVALALMFSPFVLVSRGAAVPTLRTSPAPTWPPPPKPPPSSVHVTVTSPGSPGSSSGGGGGGDSSLPSCASVIAGDPLGAPQYDSGMGDAPGLWPVGARRLVNGVIYLLTGGHRCVDAGGAERSLKIWEDEVTVDDLINAARGDALGLIPVTAVTFTPPADNLRTFVNVPTWFAYSPAEEWAPTPPGQADAGPFHALVTVEPKTLEFSSGDGGVSCEGPGSVPSPEELLTGGPCSYTYSAPGVFDASVTAHWEVHIQFWRDGQAPIIDDLEDYPQTTDYTVTVAEIQTIGEDG